jgi:hypothetical protein
MAVVGPQFARPNTVIVKHNYNTTAEKQCLLTTDEWFTVFHTAAKNVNSNPETLNCPRCWKEFTVYNQFGEHYQFGGSLGNTVCVIAEYRPEFFFRDVGRGG